MNHFDQESIHLSCSVQKHRPNHFFVMQNLVLCCRPSFLEKKKKKVEKKCRKKKRLEALFQLFLVTAALSTFTLDITILTKTVDQFSEANIQFSKILGNKTN